MPQKWILSALATTGLRRLAALFGLIGLTLLVSTGPAAAHDVLLGSDPPDGASLMTPPTQISLTFSEPVQPGFTTVTVTGPDGNQWQEGAAVENGAVVSVPLRALGPAGEYTIGYQVLSADSHPVRGSVRFILTTPGRAPSTPLPSTAAPASPAPETGTTSPESDALPAPESDAPPAATPAPAAQTSDSEGLPVWPWVVGGGLLLAAGVAVAVWVSRSRS